MVMDETSVFCWKTHPLWTIIWRISQKSLPDFAWFVVFLEIFQKKKHEEKGLQHKLATYKKWASDKTLWDTGLDSILKYVTTIGFPGQALFEWKFTHHLYHTSQGSKFFHLYLQCPALTTHSMAQNIILRFNWLVCTMSFADTRYRDMPHDGKPKISRYSPNDHLTPVFLCWKTTDHISPTWKPIERQDHRWK